MTTAIDEDLIERILEVTESPESTNFYKKAIFRLGSGAVEEELGELRYALKKRQIDSPARYFTTLLKKRIHQSSLSSASAQHDENPGPNQASHFSPNQIELFKELEPVKVKKGESGIDKVINKPYSKNSIPWATFIGPDFFTLSTNKNKSDEVMAKFRTLDGEVSFVPMIRGRYFPGDQERGILTAEHGRILGALEEIWVQQGCRYNEFKNRAIICYCDVSIREIARLLDWKNFGGRDLDHLKRKVIDLNSFPYYIRLDQVEEFKRAGFKGYGFTLVGDVTIIEKVEVGRPETIVSVRFSDTFSRQLLARRTVSRSKSLIKHRSELAFLLRLYLEPILISRQGGDYTIELNSVITILNLPEAKWHKQKSRRRDQFQKAIKELNGQKTFDGRSMSVEIIQGLNKDDYMLIACLEGGSSNTSVEFTSGQAMS